MAGEWIKMRTNLWDDPRVMRLCDETDQAEATIIGGLYWLWAAADEHSEDGIMSGLTLRAIDRKTGIKGFGQSLCEIGWLADHPEGVRLVNFDDHNGSSAKKRCQTAKRVANHRSDSAHETQSYDACNAPSVTPALAREDRDKSITSISSARAPEPEPVDKFAMFDTWQPSDSILGQMQTAGVPIQVLNHETLTEFRSYWSSRDSPRPITQAEWDHKFLKHLISQKHKTGVSHANTGQRTGKLSAVERVRQLDTPDHLLEQPIGF